MSDNIADLARQAGAELQKPLGAQDIVTLLLHDDGALTVVTATGQSITACSPAELDGDSRNTANEVIETLGRLVPNGTLKPGVTYHRRRAVLAEDKFGNIFTEAGR